MIITYTLSNQLLQLFTGDMKKRGCKITAHVEYVREKLFRVKGSIVESAILRRFTVLKANPVNTCKWTEMFRTCHRFGRMFDDLVKVTLDERSKLEFDTSAGMKEKNKKFENQLNAFSQVHGRLQKLGLARNEGQHMMDMLHGTIRLKKTNPSHGK